MGKFCSIRIFWDNQILNCICYCLCLANFIKSNHSKHKVYEKSFHKLLQYKNKKQEAQRKRIKTEEKAKVVAAVWRTELIRFLAALDICHQDDFEKRINRIKTTWRNGCFEKMDDHPLHTMYQANTLTKWMFSQ